jgi:5-(aminomethyl)-3-furanmethanol phosphate kinase
MSLTQCLCDVFVKIGGSILDNHSATAELVPHIAALSRHRRIVILPGGGRAAKRIKANHATMGGNFYSLWRGSAFSLEINAYLLGSYSTAFSIVTCAAEIASCVEAGQVAVLAPANAILNSLYLMPDWLVTTDSIGLHFAATLEASRYVVVSDVNGIYSERPARECEATPIARLDVDGLERLRESKLDSAFAKYFRRHALPTVIVNGMHPGRVRAAICGDPTIGTEITVPE